MFITLISAGNGGKAKLESTERRIVSGDPPHGELSAATRRTANLKRLTAAALAKTGDLWYNKTNY